MIVGLHNLHVCIGNIFVMYSSAMEQSKVLDK